MNGKGGTGRLRLNNMNQLILQCKYLVHIGPWISNDIAGVRSARTNVDAVSEKWIVDRAVGTGCAGDRSKYQERQLIECSNIILGIGNEEGIVAGRCLLKGCYFFVANTGEYHLIIKEPYIVGGTAVGHVCDTQTAVSGRNIGAAHIGNFR